MTHLNHPPAPGMRPAITDAGFPLIASRLPKPDALGIIDHAFGMHEPAHIIGNPTALRAALIKDKLLFFRAIEELANRRAPGYSVEAGFPHAADGLIGSSTVICVSQFQRTYPEYFSRTGQALFPGSTESTTEFQTGFGFIGSGKFSFSAKVPNGFASPFYCIDDRVVDFISNDAAAAPLLPAILNAFAQQSVLAEHDYIHALTVRSDNKFNLLEDDDPYHGGIYEKWSLAAHATVCAHLFTNKRRKEAYIEWVADYFGQLENLQETLPPTKTSRDVVTYLAEIGFHRVARVLPPNDPDLVASKAAQIMDRLNLSRPETLSDDEAAKAGYSTRNGREKLWIHTAMSMGARASDYEKVFLPIHDPDLRFSALVFGKDSERITYKLDAIRLLSYQQHLLQNGRPKAFQP